jgi:hypothetical protein
MGSMRQIAADLSRSRDGFTVAVTWPGGHAIARVIATDRVRRAPSEVW